MNHKLPIGILISTFLFLFAALCSSGQVATKLSIQGSPLLSYYLVENAKANYDFKKKMKINNPRLGLSSSVRLEAEINNKIILGTGISYMMRNNSYYVMYADTTMMPDSMHMGYAKDFSQKFNFIGLPVSIGIGYLNKPTLKIYQTIGIELFFLFDATSKEIVFYESFQPDEYSTKKLNGKKDVMVSAFTSVVVAKNINSRIAIKFEPTFYFMLSNALEDDNTLEKFMDLKLDVGVVYNL